MRRAQVQPTTSGDVMCTRPRHEARRVRKARWGSFGGHVGSTGSVRGNGARRGVPGRRRHRLQRARCPRSRGSPTPRPGASPTPAPTSTDTASPASTARSDDALAPRDPPRRRPPSHHRRDLRPTRLPRAHGPGAGPTPSPTPQPRPETGPVPPPPPPQSGTDAYESQILALVNAERSAAGLRPLAAQACAGRVRRAVVAAHGGRGPAVAPVAEPGPQPVRRARGCGERRDEQLRVARRHGRRLHGLAAAPRQHPQRELHRHRDRRLPGCARGLVGDPGLRAADPHTPRFVGMRKAASPREAAFAVCGRQAEAAPVESCGPLPTVSSTGGVSGISGRVSSRLLPVKVNVASFQPSSSVHAVSTSTNSPDFSSP